MPERTRCKGDRTGSGVTKHHAEQFVVQNAEVNVKLEPLGDHHVPVRYELASVAREFPANNVHHLDAIPARVAVLVLAVVGQTDVGTRTLTEVPGEVVLAESEFAGNVVVDNTIAERVREELVGGDVDRADHLGELEADVACHCHHHATQHEGGGTRDLTLVLRPKYVSAVVYEIAHVLLTSAYISLVVKSLYSLNSPLSTQ